MQLAGLMLMAGLVIAAVSAGLGSARGYSGKFWRLSLDDKLDFVHDHRPDWWWMAVADLAAIFAATAGMAGATYLLADDGAPVLAYAALGGYLLAMSAWVFGLITQTAGAARAATQRAESGATPPWISGMWDACYLAEWVWVIGANLAYVLVGWAILQSGLVAAWAGWAAVVIGIGIPAALAMVRDLAPQLSLLVPFILGIALLVG
ncbi:MAG TPA: hypothetical protein VLB85_14205 [Acidimicrobiia bacterium]|nr:hypothetical protein [Acidimicrobiia bacterium]